MRKKTGISAEQVANAALKEGVAYIQGDNFPQRIEELVREDEDGNNAFDILLKDYREKGRWETEPAPNFSRVLEALKQKSPWWYYKALVRDAIKNKDYGSSGLVIEALQNPKISSEEHIALIQVLFEKWRDVSDDSQKFAYEMLPEEDEEDKKPLKDIVHTALCRRGTSTHPLVYGSGFVEYITEMWKTLGVQVGEAVVESSEEEEEYELGGESEDDADDSEEKEEESITLEDKTKAMLLWEHLGPELFLWFCDTHENVPVYRTTPQALALLVYCKSKHVTFDIKYDIVDGLNESLGIQLGNPKGKEDTRSTKSSNRAVNAAECFDEKGELTQAARDTIIDGIIAKIGESIDHDRAFLEGLLLSLIILDVDAEVIKQKFVSALPEEHKDRADQHWRYISLLLYGMYIDGLEGTELDYSYVFGPSSQYWRSHEEKGEDRAQVEAVKNRINEANSITQLRLVMDIIEEFEIFDTVVQEVFADWFTEISQYCNKQEQEEVAEFFIENRMHHAIAYVLRNGEGHIINLPVWKEMQEGQNLTFKALQDLDPSLWKAVHTKDNSKRMYWLNCINVAQEGFYKNIVNVIIFEYLYKKVDKKSNIEWPEVNDGLLAFISLIRGTNGSDLDKELLSLFRSARSLDRFNNLNYYNKAYSMGGGYLPLELIPVLLVLGKISTKDALALYRRGCTDRSMRGQFFIVLPWFPPSEVLLAYKADFESAVFRKKMLCVVAGVACIALEVWVAHYLTKSRYMKLAASSALCGIFGFIARCYDRDGISQAYKEYNGIMGLVSADTSIERLLQNYGMYLGPDIEVMLGGKKYKGWEMVCIPDQPDAEVPSYEIVQKNWHDHLPRRLLVGAVFGGMLSHVASLACESSTGVLKAVAEHKAAVGIVITGGIVLYQAWWQISFNLVEMRNLEGIKGKNSCDLEV